MGHHAKPLDGGGPHALVSGVWTWFTDPRIIQIGQTWYIGSIDNAGSVSVTRVTPASNTLSSTVLFPGLQVDDHANPAMLRRDSDGRLMAFYSAHNGAAYYVQISTNPDDASAWGAAIDIDAALGLASYSYANPIQLTGETDDPIYLFFRAYPHQYYTVSTDGGGTWAAGVQWLVNGTERPYLKVARNGTTRIDLAFTDGHPNSVVTNSIYHGYYEGGNLYQSDGTLIGAINAGPYEPADFTRVYDGTTNRAWIHEMRIDGSGNPVLAYATFPTTTDHRYRYARWNGSAWSDAQICTAGTYLYAGELYYSGGVCIDPDDVNIVFASRETGDGTHRLYKYTTSDGGANWSNSQVTTVKAFRPYAVGGKVFYVTGIYTTYSNYATNITVEDA